MLPPIFEPGKSSLMKRLSDCFIKKSTAPGERFQKPNFERANK